MCISGIFSSEEKLKARRFDQKIQIRTQTDKREREKERKREREKERKREREKERKRSHGCSGQRFIQKW